MNYTASCDSPKGKSNRPASVEDTDSKLQPPNAIPLPDVSAPTSGTRPSVAKGTNSQSPHGGRSSSRARVASTTRSSSLSPRAITPPRKGRGQVQAALPPVRVGGNNGGNRTKKEISKITADALALINPSAFKKGNLSKKQMINRMMKECLQAHRVGARHFLIQFSEGNKAIWDNYVNESYLPHSHEIQSLVSHLKLVESTSREKLLHANAVTSCALNGIEQLLQRVTNVGTQIRKCTNVLAEKPDVLISSAGADKWSKSWLKDGSADLTAMQELGTPVRDVCGLDAMLSDPHPPAFRISLAEQNERDRLSRIFSSIIDSIGADEEERRVNGSSPSGSQTTQVANGSPAEATTECPPLMTDSRNDEFSASATQCTSPVLHSPCQQSCEDILKCMEEKHDGSSMRDPQADRTHYVLQLQQNLDAVGAAFVELMDRVLVQHQQYQHRIVTQKSVLDAQATRLKLADYVLRDTVEQGTVEVLSAVAVAHKLSLDLRESMEVSERNMNAALTALIEQSAEVCFDNGILNEYSALITNKENCLGAFMSQMERQVVEQADVLWKAQQGLSDIWKLRQQWQLKHSTGAAGEADESVGKSEGNDGNRTALPPLYKARLEECDRATLLSFLERLLMHCPEATTHVIAALDEHDAFCATHPKETAASREALARATNALQLIQKLDEEGKLHCSAPHTREPLSVRLRRLVEQHDAYIDFNEAYARALVRQADAERRQDAQDGVAFFDSRTPVPEPQSSAVSRQIAPVKAQTMCEGQRLAAASCSELVPVSAAEAKKNSLPLPAMPYLSLWARKQQDLITRQYQTGAMDARVGSNTVGTVVGYLERRTPHLATPAMAPPASLFEAPPSSTQSGLQADMSAAAPTFASAGLPPPPVPPRKGLVSYVLSTYGSTPENTDGDARTTQQEHSKQAKHTTKAEKSKAAMSFRDGDHQFINLEREIRVQLD
ncbi:hypothetical protein, conserved [Leishmania tarentolae]|uniref:Uncharacterized protein n=1 Tax=Leishmania tarentolae TaxID=5689 RepID=A0A640KXI9_LEITA|nr:hypothetical protein, conserved [Leishmania tarentolae]